MSQSQQMKEMDNNVIQGLKQKTAEVEQKQAAPASALTASKCASTPPPMPPACRLSGRRYLALCPDLVLSIGTPNDRSTPHRCRHCQRQSFPKEPGIAAFEVSDGVATNHAAMTGRGQSKQDLHTVRILHAPWLMGGLMFPPGGQLQNNPWPILLVCRTTRFCQQVPRQGEGVLHSRSGYGDISSGTSLPATRIAVLCLSNGEVVDATIKGYGRRRWQGAGLRGRLVSKQGRCWPMR